MNNEILEVINNTLREDDKDLANKIYEISNKVLNAPLDTELTIAEIINYNPEVEMIDSLSQGLIKSCIEKICDKKGLELVRTDDSFGGLSLYSKFKIVKSNITEYIDSLKKYGDIHNAINDLHELENKSNKNYEIFAKEEYDKLIYIVVESIAWEKISRMGYQIVKWDIYDVKDNNKEINIIIKIRNYNGSYGKGSIFEDKTSIKYISNENDSNALCILRLDISFCLDESLGSNVLSSISNEIPMIINKETRDKFDLYIKNIKENKNYKYNESHYSKERFDPKKLNYVDIIIDDENFEIPSDDKIFFEIAKMFNIEFYNKILMQNYNSILDKVDK